MLDGSLPKDDIFLLATLCVVAPILVLLHYRTVLLGFTFTFMAQFALGGLSDLFTSKLFGIDDPLSRAPSQLAVYAHSSLGLLAMSAAVMLAWQDLPQRIREMIEKVPPFKPAGHGAALPPRTKGPESPARALADRQEMLSVQFGNFCLAFGLAFTFLPLPHLTTVSALIDLWRYIVTVGLAIYVIEFHRTKRPFYLLVVVGGLFLLALRNAVLSGHVGYTNTIFYLVVLGLGWSGRLRLGNLAASLALFALLAVLFTGWMHSRNNIRTRDQTAPTTVGKMLAFAKHFEVPSIREAPEQWHIYVRRRLSFAELHARQYRHQPARQPYVAKSDLFWRTLASVTPRLLWPNKPVTAGGSALITKYTGRQFTSDTSVDTGVQLHFYALGGFWTMISLLFAFTFCLARLELELLARKRTIDVQMGMAGLLVYLSGGGGDMARMVWFGAMYFASFYLAGYWYKVRLAPKMARMAERKQLGRRSGGSFRRSSGRSSKGRSSSSSSGRGGGGLSASRAR